MKKRTVWLIPAGILFLACAAVCGFKVWQSTYAPDVVESESLSAAETPVELPPEESAVPAVTDVKPLIETPVEDTVEYVSPIDFDALTAINSDIYAWLEIDDTNISYPVVQSTDDTYYLNHNSDGNYSANGSIFSESAYNEKGFTDPVTVLYGHHMSSGAMFGKLQMYFTDSDYFTEHPTFDVYTPGAHLVYGVFAAVPYPGAHILHYNDFTDPGEFAAFFESIMNTRDLNARFNEDYAPQEGDHVLILSTCLTGNNTRRFLVMATLLADSN